MISRLLHAVLNGLLTSNGKLLSSSGGPTVTMGWNAYFHPNQFSLDVLKENWIDSSLLGQKGVGDLSNVPGIQENIMDNRFITEELKTALCQKEEDDQDKSDFRNYFSLLVELAWPENAEFWLCCSEPAGSDATSACASPDYIFSSKRSNNNQEYEPLVLAPHFLTEKFESGQQEALTAALIAKLNTQGRHLVMDLTGHVDWGEAGTQFISGKNPSFPNYLGNAWGNMFLDCSGRDTDHVLCQASKEEDRVLGRNSLFHGIPMFTCSGQSNYPTKESGKACFSKDMEANEQDGCGLVAAVGPCDEVCLGGFCGVNVPPLEGRGTENVLYVYMGDFPSTESKAPNWGLWIVLPVLSFILVTLIVYKLVLMKRAKKATKTLFAEPAESKDAGVVATEYGTDSDAASSGGDP
jgi:hypothetical protein